MIKNTNQNYSPTAVPVISYSMANSLNSFNPVSSKSEFHVTGCELASCLPVDRKNLTQTRQAAKRIRI